MKRVSVSGTFNRFHKGHIALIDRAFDAGDEIVIGITSDEFASSKKVKVAPYEDRKRTVESYVRKKGKPYSFMTVNDPLGIDAMMSMDVLVVSEETVSNGKKIVDILKGRGKDIELIVIPLIGSDKCAKISSTDIIKGLYDENGE